MPHTLTLTFTTSDADSDSGSIAAFIDLFRYAYLLAAGADVSSVRPMSFDSGWKPAVAAVQEAARTLTCEQRVALANGSIEVEPLHLEVLLGSSPLSIVVTGGKPALIAASLLAGGRLIIGTRTVEADLGTAAQAVEQLRESLCWQRDESLPRGSRNNRQHWISRAE